ncbi:hypothetical protein MBLNU13_g11496t1 [Cladosporium sp. NU13]
MPSIKPGIKSLGKVTSKMSFIKVPRLQTPPLYTHWLKHLLAIPHNKKATEAWQKADVDLFYRELAIQQFKKDDESLKIAFAERDSQASEKLWRLFVPQSTAHNALTEQAAKLRLPRLDAWDTQTYRDFADQAQRQNPCVPFTKDLMDETFRRAVSALPKAAVRAQGTRPESMITRCLGKESKEYWKA